MIDEFDNFVNELKTNKFQTPILLLESYTLGTIAPKLDNLHDSFEGAIVVLDKFDQRSLTKQQQSTFLADKEYICKQIRRKMLNDKMKHHPIMDGLQPETIKVEKTGIVGGTFKGYRMQFTIESPDNQQINPADWL